MATKVGQLLFTGLEELTEVAGQYGFTDELNASYDWTALTNNAPMATKF